MTLFRGFGDDMPLMPWLEQKIWPNEAKMTREDVYWGAKLACLEMIKSGTTTFFDMYQRPRVTADVTEEMGLRGIIAGVCFDGFDKEEAEKCKRHNERLIQDVGYVSPLNADFVCQMLSAYSCIALSAEKMPAPEMFISCLLYTSRCV